MPARRCLDARLLLTPPVQLVPFRYLLIIPVLLVIATAAALFIHSDVDIALLWSQCHSHARIPALSRIPLLGTPSCFYVSFFEEALDSLRSRAIMAPLLSLVAALVTVCTVEAARLCNRPNALIVYPTLTWLVFNLLGGAVVWQLVITPSFMHRARMLYLAARRERRNRREGRNSSSSSSSSSDGNEDDDGHGEGENTHHGALTTKHARVLPDSEVVAIPIAVLVGYILPSILMIHYNTPTLITIWLFFPVHVSLIRQAVRWIVVRARRSAPASIHFESHWQALALVYAAPALCSLLSQVLLFSNLFTTNDDRRQMTKLTMSLIEIDFQFIGLTVLYWVFVESGWRVPLTILLSTFVVGPGAGVCLGWFCREGLVKHGFAPAGEFEEEEDDGQDEQNEETPLLR